MRMASHVVPQTVEMMPKAIQISMRSDFSIEKYTEFPHKKAEAAWLNFTADFLCLLHLKEAAMARVMAEMLFLCMVLPWTVLAQGGYYFSRTITLPPQMILSPVSSMPVAVNREDVKAIGMGRAQVAMGTTFNALTYNPALLAHKRFALEVPSLQASLPAETYDAVLFLQDNRSEFEQAFFLEDLRRGVDQFNVAQTNEERLRALQVVQHGLSFPRELLDHVIGPSTSPGHTEFNARSPFRHPGAHIA